MKYKLLRFSLLSMLVMFFGGLAFAQDEPAVTLDFTSQDNWNIPTSGNANTELKEFTDGTYTIKLFAANNYKLNNGYLILGKEGSFLQLPEVDFDVAKIEVVGTSGASEYVKQVITNDHGALVCATETTGAKNVTNVYELEGANQKAGVYRIQVTSNHNTQISKVFIYKADASDTRQATTITLGEYETTGEVGGSMNLPSATVTTASGTPLDVAVTWSSSNPEVASIGETAAVINFLAAGTTTIKAEYKGDENTKPSSASFELTVTVAPIEETFTSLKALQEAVTETSTPVKIQFNDVFVTAVKGNNAYLADAQGYGVLVYQKDHGLETGQVLNGTIDAKLVLYRGQTEITNFSTEGLTITNTELTPVEKTISDITAANQSTLVTLKGVTFSNGKLSDGTNEITYYDNFSAGSLEEGATYDITGIVIVFNTTLEIAPRTADDIVKTSGGQPVDERLDLTLSFPQESYEAILGEDFEEPVLTVDPAEYDGMISYKSSDAKVATVSYEGEVTLVGPGTVTITAEAMASQTYKEAEASYTLTVNERETPPEPGEIANPYTYTFESKVFAAEGTQMLANAYWTLATDAGYFGNDGTKGQQFGSSKAAATTITLTTADIPGTITKVVVNTSGANDIDATFSVSVGQTEFQYAGDAAAVTTSAALTNTATDYEFTGSASGAITLSWANKSAKAIYVKSIYVEYTTGDEPIDEPTEFVFRDFAVELNSLLTDNDGTSVTFGLAVAEDGSVIRTEADAENNAATITGATGNDHGLQRFHAIVPVEGAVQITMGTCSWGGDVTVRNAEGETVATFTTKKGEGGTGCYGGNGFQDENIVSAKYVGEATMLTIDGGGYVNFFAVQAIEASSVDVAYSLGDVDCLGDIVPTGGTFAKGDEYTIPAKNFTLYKEGYTLTGWTDGTNTYDAGATITLESDLNLTPVFTENKVTLADRTEAVTVKFDFQKNNGAPNVQWQNQDNLVWVAQAQVNGATIDVPTHFSTAPGKFNNTNWGDWCQLNDGTTFKIPSCKGATISIEGYNVLGEPAKEGQTKFLTIDGQNDYTHAKTVSYEIAGNTETVDVVIGEEGSYYRYIQVVLPVQQSQGGGESFENVAGTIHWPVGNEQQPTISEEIAGAISNASVSAGNELTISTAKYFDTDMVHYTPVNSNAGNVEGVMIEYRVKPLKGITFQPTQIDYAAVKVGTDNATYSWSYTVDGVESTITQIDPKPDLLRNNGSNSVESGGTAKLMHTETFANVGPCDEFTFRFYISACANNKNICIGNVTISGIVNGESVSVNMYDLATVVSPEEAGSINVYPKADQYEEGSEVTLTATENFGYDFVNWTNAAGEEVSTEAKFKYTMNADETLTANFVAVETYELALAVDGTNDYMVTISPDPTMVDGKMMYEEGTAVQLTANQYEGLVTFTNWSDGETNSSKIVSMTEDIQLTAMYAEADIIAGWDFYTAGGNGRKADFAAEDNDGDALNLVNTETGETSGWLDKSWLGAGGYESFKGAAVNWKTGSGNGDVGHWHWQTKINAEAFTDINVQFQMLYNYNAYQTYNAEYSLDGESWTKFGSITMTGTKAPASFSEQLPAEANNQKDLFIRMLADKTSNVDGAASANDGNTLAMFFITGTPKLIDDGKAPVLVSTVPADGATGASASGKIVLTFDERVKVVEGAVGYINDLRINSNMQNPVTPIVNGKTITFEYKGLEYGTGYQFRIEPYIVSDLTDNFLEEISFVFTTMERPIVEKKLYDYVVENTDDLVAAITAAQARSDKNVRYRIFIKNGNYTIPLKENNLVAKAEGYEVPECITFINTQNLSLIGESRDGVIITNGIDPENLFNGQYGKTSKYDGIGNSDVFQISGSDYYFQDLTIESGMADATGRDLAVQDKATRTIYKNTGLRGYQDTWTSNNDNGLYYFEDGYVRGRTDYMCGKGDAFFNGVELRQIAGGYAAVPSKSIKYGFTYKDCVINGEPAVVNYATGETRSAADVDGNYTLGRPWGSGTPVALFIDTHMNVVPSAIGWNEMSNGWPKRFAEYNSMTSTGSVIDLSGRKKVFGEGHENNPVLTAEEALEAGNLHNMFGDWDPTLATEQAPTPTGVELAVAGKKLTWSDSNYALLYAIVKDGKVVDFTLDNSYTVDDVNAVWTIRAANEMGGLGEASEAASVTTGITTVETSTPVFNGETYTMQGIRVNKAQKGLYIVNGRKVVMK